MANIKISDLTAAAAASGTQEFEVNDSLTSKKVTGAQVLAYVESNLTIQNNAVTTAKIADSNVTTAKIADSNVTTAKIADSAVTLAKMANVATGTVLGRSTAGTGVPEALTTLPAVSGANVTSLNASNLSSGTVGTARLGSGTANSTTYLRGDQTWATAGGAPANLGDIGAVLLAAINTTSSLKFGDTVAGSNCYYATGITTTTGGGSNIFSEGTAAPPTTSWTWQNGYATRTTTGNTGYTAPGGSTTLSGTWRVLSMVGFRSSDYSPCGNETSSLTRFGLIQRIS